MFIRKNLKILTSLSLLSFSYINYKSKRLYCNSFKNVDISSIIESSNYPGLFQLLESTEKLNDEETDEEFFTICKPEQIKDKAFIQFDIKKIKEINRKANNAEVIGFQLLSKDSLIQKMDEYFQKIILIRNGDQFYALSSFCGYDLTDLSKGELIGDRLICPTCLSEYNIEKGNSEQGPNTRYLATFPAVIRNKVLKIKLPSSKIPIFKLPEVAETGNILDPRHFVLIGDNETVYGAIDILTKVFTGRISIITHNGDNKFIDYNKLKSSFFPIKSSSYIKLISDEFLNTFKIFKYENKVLRIDNINRLITLENNNKIPFDKLIIAVGSQRKKVNYNKSNIFNLYNLEDHKRIHNAIVKDDVKNVVVISSLLEGFEIVTALRKYLNAINKKDTNVILLSEKNSFLESVGTKDSLLILQKYLQENNIIFFRGIEEYKFENNQNDKLKKIIFNDSKNTFTLNSEVCIIQENLDVSNINFIKNIIITNNKLGDKFKYIYGNILVPDDRMSLHENNTYPHIFAAGNCCINNNNVDFMDLGIRTLNYKTNFQLGYLAALNMLEKHVPFDDIIVESVRVMNKRLIFLGNDRSKYDDKVVYKNPKNNDFIVYLFTNKKLSGCLVYGFKNLHIYIRELMRINGMPGLQYVKNNLENIPEYIFNEVNKYPIKCYKHEVLKKFEINVSRYTYDDQQYAHDLMKRSNIALKEYRKKMDEDLKVDRNSDTNINK